MSPLERNKDGQITTYPDDAELNQNQWAKMLDVAPESVAGAVHRGGLRPRRVESPYENQPMRRLTRVGDFPALIEGFQKTATVETRVGIFHHHPWSEDVDTRASEFTVTPSSGDKLTFIRSEGNKSSSHFS